MSNLNVEVVTGGVAPNDMQTIHREEWFVLNFFPIFVPLIPSEPTHYPSFGFKVNVHPPKLFLQAYYVPICSTTDSPPPQTQKSYEQVSSTALTSMYLD